MAIEPSRDNLVTVFETKDEAEAWVVKGLLDTEGIESILTNPEVPENILPGVGELVVRVLAGDAERAREVIQVQRRTGFSEDFTDVEAAEDRSAPADLRSRQS